jgi:hypothetical protein
MQKIFEREWKKPLNPTLDYYFLSTKAILAEFGMDQT